MHNFAIASYWINFVTFNLQDPFLQFDDRRSDDNLMAESPTSIQMEQDVDLQLIQERESAIKQLEVSATSKNYWGVLHRR